MLHDGDFVGEIAILCDTPRNATVSRKSEVKALRIRKEPFFELLHQFPEMAVEIDTAPRRASDRTTAELVARADWRGGAGAGAATATGLTPGR